MLHHASSSGVRIAYSIEGVEGAPVVMLANSLAADRSMWSENLPALTREFRVLRYDMRGHGASDAPAGDYTLEMLTDDAVAVLDHASLERVHFVGVSLGGIVGQRLGALHGHRLHSLALCNTMSHQGAPQAWRDRIPVVREQGMQSMLESTVARWFTASYASDHPQAMERIRRMILGTSVNGYCGCAAAVSTLAQTALLDKIRVPTLVLTGREDPAATPAMATDMHGRIEGSELQIIEDAAHLPNIERAAMFDAVMIDFIARHAPKATSASR